jgi:superfamily II DNA or RNA helicase
VTTTVDIIIDSMLRVPVKAIGEALAEEILEEVTRENPAYAEAKEKRRDLAGIPEFFDLGQLYGNTLILPRGFALELKRWLREEGFGVRWRDRRRYRKGAPLGKEEFSYREHQPAAVDAIRRHQQGIYKAPTGSGKTVTVCGAIWELSPRRSLILVDRSNLVDQWMDRISSHVGVNRDDIGEIGGGVWSENRITVATVQTLYKHRERLEKEGWFAQWDFVCLDEMHHVTAETFRDLMARFPARYRFGVSATPDKTGVYELALDTLGEVFYTTTLEELRELGLLLEPVIEVVPTKFKFAYWGDHKANKHGVCEVPGCPKSGKVIYGYHRHKNNYMKLKTALVADEGRNELIVEKLIQNHKHVQLVITDQTSHIDKLEAELALCDKLAQGFPTVYILTGKQTKKKRKEIIDAIEERNEPCIILSTIAGEALDIPIIDRVHLVWPTRNPRKTEQNVGRGTRTSPLKEDTIIFDYVDELVGVLLKQFGFRRKECYNELDFEVITPDDFRQPKGGLGIVALV